jgi:hypothetical protein
VAALDLPGRLTYAQMLHDTIHSTAQANAELRVHYRNAIKALIIDLAPKAVLCESFVVRGFGTNLIELVNLMLGSLQMVCHDRGIEEHLVMPSSWKGAIKKELSLDKVYAFAASKRLPPHIVDAICLATYLRMGKTFKGY